MISIKCFILGCDYKYSMELMMCGVIDVKRVCKRCCKTSFTTVREYEWQNTWFKGYLRNPLYYRLEKYYYEQKEAHNPEKLKIKKMKNEKTEQTKQLKEIRNERKSI